MSSSLDCKIWHYFCSFSYSRVCFDCIKHSSDVINCMKKKWERKISFPPLLMRFLSNTLCSRLQYTYFSMHFLNVILVKELEESNSPAPWKFIFLLDWNFLDQLRRHKKRKLLQVNRLDCRKTSKKNARFYSPDYLSHVFRIEMF